MAALVTDLNVSEANVSLQTWKTVYCPTIGINIHRIQSSHKYSPCWTNSSLPGMRSDSRSPPAIYETARCSVLGELY